MTDNDKLLAWQDNGSTPGKTLPDYPNDAAACDSLVDTLVEKNYGVTLQYAIDTKAWKILIVCDDIINDNQWWVEKMHKTRREAIVAACLEVARKEMDV